MLDTFDNATMPGKGHAERYVKESLYADAYFSGATTPLRSIAIERITGKHKGESAELGFTNWEEPIALLIISVIIHVNVYKTILIPFFLLGFI